MPRQLAQQRVRISSSQPLDLVSSAENRHVGSARGQNLFLVPAPHASSPPPRVGRVLSGVTGA